MNTETQATGHDGDRQYGEPDIEPDRLPPEREDGDCERPALRVPDPVAVRGGHTQRIGARGEVGVGNEPPLAVRVDPPFIDALQHITIAITTGQPVIERSEFSTEGALPTWQSQRLVDVKCLVL